MSDIMDKLKGTKYFTKIDVRWGYNNIQIQKGDEWKAAFKTCLNPQLCSLECAIPLPRSNQ